MKIYLISLLLILTIRSAAGAEFIGKWNQNLTHELVINCEQDEKLCSKLCSSETQCKIPQPLCRSCIGTGLYMTQVFHSFGEFFSSAGSEVSEEELSNFLINSKFVTIETNSPFNIIDEVNSRKFELELERTCGQPFTYPLLIGRLNNRFELRKIEYLVCHYETGTRVLKINSSPLVNLQEKHLLD